MMTDNARLRIRCIDLLGGLFKSGEKAMIYEKIIKCGHFKIAEEYKTERKEFENIISDLKDMVYKMSEMSKLDKLTIRMMEEDQKRKDNIIEYLHGILSDFKKTLESFDRPYPPNVSDHRAGPGGER
jgi:hypothetical protein